MRGRQPRRHATQPERLPCGAKRVAYLECEKHLGCPRRGDDSNALLRQKRGEDSGLLSRHVVPANRAAWLGHNTRHETKSNCLVVMGHWHDTRRNELDWRR
jgi:hypothetical protein